MADPITTYEKHCCSAYSVLSNWSPYHHAAEDVCQMDPSYQKSRVCPYAGYLPQGS